MSAIMSGISAADVAKGLSIFEIDESLAALVEAAEAEAEANIEDAIRESLAARAELGLPLTVSTKEIEVAV